MQNTTQVLMVRPAMFGFNAETAINNAFQMQGYSKDAQAKALLEFDNFVRKLTLFGIDVIVAEDTPLPHTPDSIFPNNWFSTHQSSTLCLYPMFAQNRRAERSPAILQMLTEKFAITNTIDFTHYEDKNQFLEGTGSIVLDRDNNIAFACLSPRTDKAVLNDFCQKLNFKPVTFTAVGTDNNVIYHTNVMLCVGKQYAIICLDSVKSTAEKDKLTQTFRQTNKEIIEISLAQMNQFAGNMLQVKNVAGEQFLVMSGTAFRALTAEQISRIRQYNQIIDSELGTIEKNGGGSARCMLAEIFLGKI